MSDTPKDAKTKPEDAPSYTVSSGTAPRSGRNVSFTIPPMPRLSFANLKNRSKAAGLFVVLIVGLLGGYIGSAIQNHTSGGGLLTGTVSNQKKVVTSQSELVSTIAKNVGQSVVSVNVNLTTAASDTNSFFGYSRPQQEQAAGTGIIISKNLILTNRHVVPSGTTSVSVTLSDGTELTDVSVLGRTASTDSLDVAILKVGNTKGRTLTPATLGDSSKAAVGDNVVAIGNALGQFQNSVTTGIISGYGRSITAGSDSSDSSDSENLDNLFQTDAAINEGNSGGPLVNLNGQVIGVNTAIASDSQNIGFAIPINDVKGLVQHAVATGKFERPYLGVRYIPLTADIAKQYGLSVSNGAYIAAAPDSSTQTIISGGPADKAGLKTGDVITRVAGNSVDESHSLTSRLGRFQPGDRVKLSVVNGDKTRTVTIMLGTAPNN